MLHRCCECPKHLRRRLFYLEGQAVPGCDDDIQLSKHLITDIKLPSRQDVDFDPVEKSGAVSPQLPYTPQLFQDAEGDWVGSGNQVRLTRLRGVLGEDYRVNVEKLPDPTRQLLVTVSPLDVSKAGTSAGQCVVVAEYSKGLWRDNPTQRLDIQLSPPKIVFTQFELVEL
jgi:hypothetical protein